MRAAFQELRDRAIKRGIVFGISFDSFERLAKETLYLNGKGNGRSRITIDRKNNRLGYVDGNLQPLTREENARKQHLYDERRVRAGLSWMGGQIERAA